jgi:hypothetical protein
VRTTSPSRHAIAVEHWILAIEKRQSTLIANQCSMANKTLGGELEVLAQFPKGTDKIDQFDPPPRGRHGGREGLQLV